MEKAYKQIEKYLNKTMTTESIYTSSRIVENLHNLIKNNGENFNLSDEELAKMDESDKFGDIAGIGRNWAHIKGGIKNFKNIYCNL